jgi:ATP-binding cassette, subfamily B (MDR/TAP), member 1
MYGIAGEHLTARLRKQMFEKLLQFEIAFYDDKEHSTGALCARLSGEAASVQGVIYYTNCSYSIPTRSI